MLLMNSWERFIQNLEEDYYVSVLYILLVIVAIIIGFIFHRRNNIGKIFLSYLFFDLSMFVLGAYIGYFSNVTHYLHGVVQQVTNTLICIVELNTYFFFFAIILKSRKIKTFLFWGRVFFSLLLIPFAINLIESLRVIPVRKFSEYIGVIEFSLIVIPSMVYYKELFGKEPVERLANLPSFWITTGVFSMAVFSIPFYSIGYYLAANKHYEHITVFFYLPLAINYILLSRGFICKNPLTI